MPCRFMTPWNPLPILAEWWAHMISHDMISTVSRDCPNIDVLTSHKVSSHKWSTYKMNSHVTLVIFNTLAYTWTTTLCLEPHNKDSSVALKCRSEKSRCSQKVIPRKSHQQVLPAKLGVSIVSQRSTKLWEVRWYKGRSRLMEQLWCFLTWWTWE